MSEMEKIKEKVRRNIKETEEYEIPELVSSIEVSVEALGKTQARLFELRKVLEKLESLAE